MNEKIRIEKENAEKIFEEKLKENAEKVSVNQLRIILIVFIRFDKPKKNVRNMN